MLRAGDSVTHDPQALEPKKLKSDEAQNTRESFMGPFSGEPFLAVRPRHLPSGLLWPHCLDSYRLSLIRDLNARCESSLQPISWLQRLQRTIRGFSKPCLDIGDFNARHETRPWLVHLGDFNGREGILICSVYQRCCQASWFCKLYPRLTQKLLKKTNYIGYVMNPLELINSKMGLIIKLSLPVKKLIVFKGAHSRILTTLFTRPQRPQRAAGDLSVTCARTPDLNASEEILLCSGFQTSETWTLDSGRSVEGKKTLAQW